MPSLVSSRDIPSSRGKAYFIENYQIVLTGLGAVLSDQFLNHEARCGPWQRVVLRLATARDVLDRLTSTRELVMKSDDTHETVSTRLAQDRNLGRADADRHRPPQRHQE